MIVHVCNLSTQEAEAEESLEVQHYAGLHSMLQSSLDYLARHCIKKLNNKGTPYWPRQTGKDPESSAPASEIGSIHRKMNSLVALAGSRAGKAPKVLEQEEHFLQESLESFIVSFPTKPARRVTSLSTQSSSASEFRRIQLSRLSAQGSHHRLVQSSAGGILTVQMLSPFVAHYSVAYTVWGKTFCCLRVSMDCAEGADERRKGTEKSDS